MQEGPRKATDYDPYGRPEPDWGAAGGGSPVAPEVSRRVRAILDNVEREAAELRAEAREEARRYLDAARRHVDGMVHDRQERIAALSDEIISRSESVLGRLEDAAPVRAGFDSLIRALGDAAERLASEVEEMNLGPSGMPPYWRATPDLEPGRDWGSGPGEPYGPGESHGPERHYEHGYGEPAGEGGSGARQASTYGGSPAQPHEPAPQARAIAIQMAAAGNTRAQVEGYLRDQLGLEAPEGLLDELFGPGSSDDARVPWTD